MNAIALPADGPGTRASAKGRMISLDEKNRLAEVIFRSDAIMVNESGVRDAFVARADAADLSLVALGLVPVLIAHRLETDALVGRVESAWFEGFEGHAILRFGRHARAEEIWMQLCDNLPLDISAGSKIFDCVAPEGADAGRVQYIVTRWQLYEISICVAGRDPNARFLTGEDRMDLSEKAIAQRASYDVDRRLQLLDKLRWQEWSDWAARAGADALATTLGLEANAVREALVPAVADQLERMVAT